MLFTEQDLSMTNAMDILNEATYLSETESLINPQTIPVKEVSRLGYGVVRFDDVDKLSEDYGIDYIDAMYAIAEASDMNPEYLAVSVPEEDIIAYPEIVNELANIVIQPLSEYDPEYQYVAECVNAYTESGDEDYLGLLLEDLVDDMRDIMNNPGYSIQTKMNMYNNLKNLDLASQENDGVIDHTGPMPYTADNIAAKKEEMRKKLIRDEPKPKSKKTKTYIGNGMYRSDVKLSNDTDNPFSDLTIGQKASLLGKVAKGKITHAGSDISTGWKKEGFKGIGKAAWQHKGTLAAVGAGAALTGAAIGGGIYAYKQYKNRPRSVIAKRIAALRGIYKKFMINAQKNPKQANTLQRMAAKILSVIDKLLGYLQTKADGR